MSDYKWITCSKEEEKGCVLVDESFRTIAFPIVHKMDVFLKAKLREHGINVSLEYNQNWEPHYNLIPVEKEYVEVTAPVYERREAKYVKVVNSYTKETVNPSQCEWVRTELVKCQEEVKKEQEQRFIDIFKRNSVDGITAWVHVSPYPMKNEIFFTEEYVPKGFIEVCYKNLHQNKKIRTVIYMKKFNAHKKTVAVKIPKGFRGLMVGVEGRNLKRIEREIQAGRIDVN